MPTLKLKPFKVQEIPIKQDGINHIMFQYKSKKQLSNLQIKNIAKGVVKNVQTKIDKKKMGLTGQLMLTQNYNKSLLWQSGKFVEFSDDFKPDFYDFTNEYEYNGDKIQDKFSEFSFTIKLLKDSGGCEGEFNDCLWYCIRDYCQGKEYLPKPISKQKKLKRLVGIKRYDAVPIDKLDMLSDKINIGISLNGDVLHVANPKYPRQITVQFQDGHYYIPNIHSIDEQLRGNTHKKDKSIVLYQELYDNENKVYYYGTDGESEFKINRDILQLFWTKPRSLKIIYRRTDDTITPIMNQYEKLIEDVDILLKESKGFINLYRQLNDTKSAMFIFGKLCRNIQPPPPITQLETDYIYSARSGGIIYGVRNVKLDNAWCYDINKMYSWILSSHQFTIPRNEGHIVQIDELPKDFFPYGIYNCKVTDVDVKQKHLLKFFKFKSNDMYTHIDLNVALEIGLHIELISKNAMLFPERINASYMFKPYFDYMLDLQKRCPLPRVKKMMNSLWGGLCRKQSTTVDMNQVDVLDLKGREITHIEPYKNNLLITVENFENKFRTTYARIFPFITSYGRYQMFQKLKSHSKSIYRIHTDGFVTDKKLFEPSDVVGGWKIEKQGKCHIHNSVNIDWNK
jgi:hypothetical protein